ncbi:PGPGW domain-containing protein [Pontiellaceae bacterium B12227]|nr:PGPGW domain-containing protein [Pontiellaceae bacterium B12227]
MKRLIWNKHTKLVLKHLAGWFCIVAGLIMFITPGQGILTVLIGVYLLADEIPLFGRIKAWLEHRFPKTADFVHKKGTQMRARFHKEKQDGPPGQDPKD